MDIQAVKKNIADIEAELAQVQEQMKKYLDELDVYKRQAHYCNHQ